MKAHWLPYFQYLTNGIAPSIVIVDVKENETDWDVFIVPQCTLDPAPLPWEFKISKDPTLTLYKHLGGGGFYAVRGIGVHP